MELGSTCPTTAGAGNRPSLLWIQLGALTTRTVAGYTPTAVGTGTLTTAGAVSPSTMAAGIEMSVLAGSGCPARSGVQLGLAGDITTATWVGLPCHPQPASTGESDSAGAGAESAAVLPSGLPTQIIPSSVTGISMIPFHGVIMLLTTATNRSTRTQR